jgi:hypothetical protein
LSALYVAGFVDRGWIAADEGTIGQSAERALQGQLPHRDFDDYTGGLTWIHALAFRLGGIRLLTLRWVLFLFFLPFVAAVFSIALRFAPVLPAAVLTLLAVVWSVPNYFASLPSWYNLFFATFGTLCLFKHLDTGLRRWLFAAGLCAGVSILMKIVGLYFVAAVLFFLLYREQVLSAASSTETPRSSLFLLSKLAFCAVFVWLLSSLFRTGLDLPDVLHFLVPALAVSAVLLWFEWKWGRGAVAERALRLFRLLLPFGVGVALPIALFLVPYVLTGSLSDLYHGVLLLPQVQIGRVRLAFPHLSTLKSTIPYALLLAFPWLVPRRWQGWFVLTLSLLLGIGVLAASAAPVYESIWNSARTLDVVAAIAGCSVLVLQGSELPVVRRQQLFLLVSVCALVSLVQFPFAAPFYFCYVAPLAALTIFAIVSLDSRAPKRVHACVLGFYLLFGMIRLNSAYCVIFRDYRPDALLAVKRGGLRVPALEAAVYERLVDVIEKKGLGRPLYAGPDSPEVYFLSACPSPTRFSFEFLGGFSGNPQALERLLEEKGIAIVALNRSPTVSGRMSSGVREALAPRYPHSLEIWKFVVMWKD